MDNRNSNKVTQAGELSVGMGMFQSGCCDEDHSHRAEGSGGFAVFPLGGSGRYRETEEQQQVQQFFEALFQLYCILLLLCILVILAHAVKL